MTAWTLTATLLSMTLPDPLRGEDEAPVPPPHPPAYGQPYGSPAGYDPISGAPYSPYPPQPQVVVVNSASPPTSVYATIGLIFGILGLVAGCCTFGVFSVVAVICGHAALRETNNNAKGGHGMAVASLVMGYIGLIPAIFLSVGLVTGQFHTPVTTPTP